MREEATGAKWVTWGEFTETRLLSEYRRLDDIRIKKLRGIVEFLRREFGHRYPLAYARPFLDVEGREILMRAQRDAGAEDDLALVVGTGQLAIRTQRFVDAAKFDLDPGVPGTPVKIAVRFKADPRYPDIAVDPEHKSGRPTVAGRNILVTTLADMVDAGDPVADVASWYSLTADQVQQAVDFTATHNLVA